LKEIEYLLTTGQIPENASIPAVELHISLLRSLILNENIPLVEIPPVPAGYDLTVCLTHDVDFASIRDHVFDLSASGFLKRAVFGSISDFVRGRIGGKKLIKNIGAAIKLPFMYLGLARDCWDQFENWIKLENGRHSTFFVIPFKNRTGEEVTSPMPKMRAAKYDITDIEATIRKLMDAGDEIGVHGIDAWHNANAALSEKDRITSVTGLYETGIRMHWLAWKENSAGILDKAGYSYDSTFGFNETVGFRAGTSQLFVPKGAETLLEMPLNIQDTSLFYSGRMHLTDEQAWEKCRSILKECLLYGGVLTILWHQRSIGPERLWGEFYSRLLNELVNHRIWFATGLKAAEWFRKRREIVFDSAEVIDGSLDIQLSGITADDLPQLTLRLFNPATFEKAETAAEIPNSIDLVWEGESELKIPI
jgi:hypothetical protein